jgi:hypothetical protein
MSGDESLFISQKVREFAADLLLRDPLKNA